MTNIVDDSGNAFSVDKSATEQSKLRIRKFSFGDGYEQRIQDGINTLEQEFSVSFVNRPEAEMNNLIDFLETKGGVTTFAYSPPNYPSGTAATITASNNRISGGGGTLSGIIDDGWVLLTGSNSDGGYSVDSTGTNTSSAIQIYQPTLGSEIGSFTVYKALGVVCENWTINIPQVGIVTLQAKLKRVYEP